jgi:hypothetical protein
MTAGRPRKFPPCPDCQQPIQASSSPYFKCACRGYVVREGQLCPRLPRATPKPVQVLLSYRGEEVTGAWVIDKVATAHYANPLIEKEVVYCTADEFEAMQQ